MKLVREHINEKFVEDSDPITDMGIGYKEDIDFAAVVKRVKRNSKTKLTIFTKKLIEKQREVYEKQLKEKLIGRTISGTFRTRSYEYVIRKFKVKNIFIEFNKWSAEINNIIIVSTSGTQYKLVTWGSESDYKITA